MKRVLLILSLITVTTFAFAGPVQELMRLAESAFSNGDYAKARAYYKDIISLQTATEEQRTDALYNFNICQARINDSQFNTGYNRAISLFHRKQFEQSRNICLELLQYNKHKLKTGALIQQCNDSINARVLTKQFADSIQHRAILQKEYNSIFDEAFAYYRYKQYRDAIQTYQKSFDSKFECLGDTVPIWYKQSLQIYQAQCNGEAITYEFAQHLLNAYSIGDVSNKIARIYRYPSDSTCYISTAGNMIVGLKDQVFDDYRCGFLGSKIRQCSGFYDTLAVYHSYTEIEQPELNSKLLVEEVREFSDDMAPVLYLDVRKDYEKARKSGKWGYINTQFKLVIKPEYDFVTAFFQGRAFVRKKGKWMIIDKSGREVCTNLFPAFYGGEDEGKCDYYRTITNSYYQDGKIWVQKKNGKSILLDLNGDVLLDAEDYNSYNILHIGEPLFDWVTFSNGLIIYRSKEKFGYMGATGKVVISPQYDLTYGFHESIAPVKIGDKWGFINTVGTQIIEACYDDVNRDGFSEGLCAVKLNGKWGYIDTQGNWVINPKYDCPYRIVNGSVGCFHEGFAAVALNGQLGYVDKFGNSTFDFQ